MKFQHLQAERTYLSFEKKFSFHNWLYTSLILPFNMEHQTQSNWCWAATSNSVSHFYSSNSPWTQCKIAGAELTLTCCTTPVPGPCNVPWYLNSALTRTSNFVSYQNGVITWLQVKQQLEAGLVIGARIGWNGGGGHFVCIFGLSTVDAIEYLHIDDPIYGKSVLKYDQFVSNYQGSGSWTHTYFTKKYFYFMWYKELLLNEEWLREIPEIRPLLNIHGSVIQEHVPVRYSIPHYAYTIGLNEIREGFVLPSEPKSLRIIEAQDGGPVALYELNPRDTKRQLIQMNTSESYFKQLDESLDRLKKYSEVSNINSNTAGELRFIKIPALNLEAFWLHYDDGDRDLITPVQRFDDSSLDWSKGYSPKEFSQLVLSLASKINSQDDLLGG